MKIECPGIRQSTPPKGAEKMRFVVEGMREVILQNFLTDCRAFEAIPCRFPDELQSNVRIVQGLVLDKLLGKHWLY